LFLKPATIRRVVLPVRILFLCLIVAGTLRGAPLISEIKLAASATALYIPVKLNDYSGWLLLDTGTPHSFINYDAARNANLKTVQTHSGRDVAIQVNGKKSGIAIVQHLSVGTLDFGPIPVMTGNLTMLEGARSSQARGTFNVCGLMGLDLLRRHNAVLNFRKELIFLPPENKPMPYPAGGFERLGFTRIPIQFTSSGHILVEGAISNHPFSFLVDTGAPFTLLRPELQRSLGIAGEITPHLIRGYHRDPMRVKAANIPNFLLGSYRVPDAYCGFSAGTPEVATSPPFAGLLGADILWSNQAILDLGNRNLYLSPDKGGR
jgi:predicted aspartyl protease